MKWVQFHCMAFEINKIYLSVNVLKMPPRSRAFVETELAILCVFSSVSSSSDRKGHWTHCGSILRQIHLPHSTSKSMFWCTNRVPTGSVNEFFSSSSKGIFKSSENSGTFWSMREIDQKIIKLFYICGKYRNSYFKAYSCLRLVTHSQKGQLALNMRGK